MIKLIDSISEFTGKVAAWVFFAIGFFITYEVISRYVFNSPTVWVDEVSRIGQIWAAYLAGAFALKHREMIVIDIAFRRPDTTIRKVVETFAICVVILFCLTAVWYGYGLWLKSTLRGHTTDTYLALPKWFTQASVWFGFGLLGLQAIAEAVKIWTVGIPADETLRHEV
ncbi:Tripartite ATP-independent periplasmic transporter, DctQ component [Pseudovibrio axinellae]|uniref:TRAP transporter small permease protein n=1 Tax=Pseudovibrio axinellae TaxID=989403 RepID=A0A165VSR3_9HYPH|nr:TRAP transporter small permease [Pseudovibrio axinellae]KZL15389.1 Tripartite ATP-independent periplasmic transporter, DctQ component [Pseudovibrio axinellae]SER54354.1 TRAP-type mannitol/chloroaromatic compound transport system, small permease component [Pseudovibrio axinellae]